MSIGTTAFTVLLGAAGRGGVGTAGTDRTSWVLCWLLLFTSFVGLVNVATGTTRTTRAELVQQARLGVPRSAIVGHLLGESGLVALFAGLIGTAVAEAIAIIAGEPITLYRLLVTAPATCLIALAASAIPALIATAVRPADAKRPVASWRPHARTRARVAVAQLLETPVRTALGVSAVAIGSAVSFLQLALLWADRRTFTGTLFGFAVALRSGGVDAAASAAVIAASVLVVGDMCRLNVGDRRAEFAGLRAQGLTGAQVVGLLGREALMLGLAGSIVGAGAGLAIMSAVGGSAANLLLQTIGTVAICTSATVLVSLASMVAAACEPRVRGSVSDRFASVRRVNDWFAIRRPTTVSPMNGAPSDRHSTDGRNRSRRMATHNYQEGSDSTSTRRTDLGVCCVSTNVTDPDYMELSKRPQCTKGKPFGDGKRRNAHYPPSSEVHGRFSRRS